MSSSSYGDYQSERDFISHGRRYRNPFFSLANNFIPNNIKTLFKYCYSFFHTDPFLSNVVRKLTEYPLTKILYDTEVSQNTRDKYDKILHEKLNINTKLIEIGLDYYTYGNCFLSTYVKTKRFLRNTKTGETQPIEKAKYQYRNYRFYSEGDESVELEIQDEPINSIEAFRVVRWDPRNIDIRYNPFTGDSEYFYEMPNSVKNGIKLGHKHLIESTPKLFLDALKENKKLKFDPKNFFHFKRPGLSSSDMAWGKPIILAAIKKIYYLQILQSGNEAIAHEHIVPKKAISPANTATLDPLTQMNLPKWTGQMEETIKKWRKDPNYIAVFPIPIGYQELGGNARGLMTTPEMKFLEETIINSLGVPIEFIKGGTSWTGSSISLRIVENMFLTYRGLLLDFLNHFLIPKLVHHLNYPEVKVAFKDFKMSDDTQAKQLVIQMAEMAKISDDKLLEVFGWNPEEIKKQQKQSRMEQRENAVHDQVAQAEAQGKAQVVMSKYQARAQMEGQRETLKIKLERLQSEIQQEQGEIPEDYLDLVEAIALRLMHLPPEMQVSSMNKLQKTAPTTYALVMEAIRSYQEAGFVPTSEGMSPTGGEEGNPNTSGVGGEPPAKKKPGTREGDKVKVRDKEKTKGNTRGEPQA